MKGESVFFSPPGSVTPGYNGCTCDCHRIPGVKHCVPCCYPGKDEGLIVEQDTGLIGTGIFPERRIVRNAKRKRKLQKRGENIWWSPTQNAWVWSKKYTPKYYGEK